MYIVKFIFAALVFQSAICAKVVTTTKPLFYVVAPLLRNIETPAVLRGAHSCVHQQHLRPSQVDKLQNAKLLFTEKSEEAFMLSKAPKGVTVKSLFLVDDGMEVLSPKRVKAKLPEIAKSLKAHYPVGYHAKIDKNLEDFEKQLIKLDQWVVSQVKQMQGKSVITTYPFLKYFSEDYELNVVRSLASSPFEAIKPRSLKKAHTLLGSGKVIGVVKDQHIPIDVLKRVFSSHKARVLELDTEALRMLLSFDGYQILIENMVQSIVRWAK